MDANEIRDCVIEVLISSRAKIGPLKNLIAPLVNDLALLVHHLVIFEDVLTDLGVFLLNGGLSTFNGLRHHLRFDCLIFIETPHCPLQGAGGEQPHQFIIETEIKATFPGVSLATRTSTQLVIDTAAVVPFGGNDV